MNCREATNMILNGQRSSALEEHLGQCPDCRALNEDYLFVSDFARMPLPDVPEELDRAVLASAAEQTTRRFKVPSFFFRMPVLRAAAAVAVLGACAALTFSAMTGGRTGSSAPGRTNPAVKTVQASSHEDVLDFLTGSAELDADLLTLSMELDQTASDMRLIASASTPSWYPAASSYLDF